MREQVGGEVGDADPGHDEEAGVVEHEGEVALALCGAPADEAVARGGLPGRGGEAEHSQRLSAGGMHEVAHLGAGQGVVAEIVIAGEGLVILLYKWMSERGAGEGEEGGRRAVPVG